ncbi:PREDICTED: uncharacterized protein LOC105971108 [Erythranthe guttata]|uniref:uncharacterized protein LOC105971108 n=1 Tax=Erythranthe guttata TaxID=4155 RepID=UPI00064DF86A|nr:PREDICTED: uncharacterized protein LOC105971108 [Erythranthe guttata]|eukprot:XP_012851409.1 PREDICTED: uncharacterized protein LOC105971108 [Erythranthe guttata]
MSNNSIRSRASNNCKHGRRHHQVRMDFTKFDGEEPRVWLNRAKQFFLANDLHGHRKVVLASYHLEGDANQWWLWFERANQGRKISWRQFEKGILLRFGHGNYEDPNESMCRLRQKGGFKEFLGEFEKLMNCLPDWPEEALMGAFMAGLREDIARDVRLFKPKDLQTAMELAKRKDEQLQFGKRSAGQTRTVNSINLKFVNPNPATTARQLVADGAKRLTWEELQRRREQNLCYHCDKKFVRGHQCKKAQALIIEAEDQGDEEGVDFDEQQQISLHAIGGESGKKAMRVSGKLENSPVEMLADNGSSLNILNSELAQRLRLKVKPIKPFLVRMANGKKLECSARYEIVPMHVNGYDFRANLYPLPIDGLDVVSGGSRIFAKGGREEKDIEISELHALIGDWKAGGELFGVAASFDREETSEVVGTDNVEIKNLLTEFLDIQTEPETLPPQREFDHRIRLHDEATVVNVRPYRYTHFKKNEIEKQVAALLKSGLMQPSTSPFSSPVLLVKKKDGSWRFCTDYRGLNDVTIKDRFPIPTVDDMLDELHGAQYYSKLDLRAGYHQIRVHPDDIHKTAFRVHNDHYEYLVMSFGLCNAPSTFQAAMNEIFRPHLRKFILVFFDDILVYSKSWEDHLQQLRTTLQILRDAHFFLKPS